MENKLNILLLDNNDRRLHNSASLMQCCGGFCINPKSTINQDDYESNSYDIIFAHYGNKEVQEHIADSDWDSKNAIIIIFSGGFPVDKEMDDYGIWWVSASHMEKKENICILLKEVVTK